MVNEDRVILMTRMAVQAEKAKGGDARINRFYRGDYVGFEIVKSVVCATIVYCILLGAYAVFRFNELLQDFYDGAGMESVRIYVLWYLVVIAVYVVISYVVYSVRFSRSRSEMRKYYSNLKKLEHTYRS